MKMHTLLLFAVAIAALLLAAPSAYADKPIKVFILAGQSNMVGTGADTSERPALLQSPQADVLFYYSTSLTTLRPGSGQNFGPEVTFETDRLCLKSPLLHVRQPDSQVNHVDLMDEFIPHPAALTRSLRHGRQILRDFQPSLVEVVQDKQRYSKAPA